MKKILLPDTVRIINTAVNGYGDTVILDAGYVKGAFFEGTSTNFTNDTDMIETYDAHCYVDETDPFVLDNSFRLEGMYLVVSLYGYPEDESWYLIKDVKLGVTKIIDNVVNNCHCFLQKCDPLEITESQGDVPPQPIGEVKVVSQLPEIGHAGYIYLILREKTEEGNIYDEYIWVPTPGERYGWEKIGATDAILYDSLGDNVDGAMTQRATTANIPIVLDDSDYQSLWEDKESE